MATPTIVRDPSLSTTAAWQLEKAAKRLLRQPSNEIGEPGAAFFDSAHALRAKTGVGQSGSSPFGGVVTPGSSPALDTSPAPTAFPLIDAGNAINAKAAELGWSGAPAGDVEAAAGAGFLRNFQNADIYVSAQTGAHEVHGAIRDKFNALGGAAGGLGLPLTDETGTPDGEGRFNHFEGGSVYWTARNGAAMVRGAIRHAWAAQGWETGILGYPVQDEHRYVTQHPAAAPSTAWSIFENGAIVAGAGGAAVARTVEMSRDTLRCLVRQEFDRVMHESPDDVGLHADSEISAVSRTAPRAVTFVIHGFHDNGAAPDTDFDITVGLGFGLVWPADQSTEPETKSLAAALVSLSVSAHGPVGTSGPVAHAIRDSVVTAFATPRTLGPPIPAGGQLAPAMPDVIDVLVTAEGGLRVLLNPLPDFASGGIRVIGAQAAVDGLGC
jgi:LGFP repeat